MAHSLVRPVSLLSLLVLGGCFPKGNEPITQASDGTGIIDGSIDVAEKDAKPKSPEIAEGVGTAASPDSDSMDGPPSPSPARASTATPTSG